MRRKGTIIHELVLFSLFRPTWKTLLIFFFVTSSLESVVWSSSRILSQQQQQEEEEDVQNVKPNNTNNSNYNGSCGRNSSSLFLRDRGTTLARTRMVQQETEAQVRTDSLFLHNVYDNKDNNNNNNDLHNTDKKSDAITWWKDKNILAKKKTSGGAGDTTTATTAFALPFDASTSRGGEAVAETEAERGTSRRKWVLYLNSFVRDVVTSIQGVRWNHHNHNNSNISNYYHHHHYYHRNHRATISTSSTINTTTTSTNHNGEHDLQNNNSPHILFMPARTMCPLLQELLNSSNNTNSSSNDNSTSFFPLFSTNASSAANWGIFGVCVAFGLFTILIIIRVARRWRKVQRKLREEEVEEMEGGERNREEEEEHQHQHQQEQDGNETTWRQGKDWCREGTRGDYFYHQFYYQQELEKELQARQWRGKSFLLFSLPESDRWEGGEDVPPSQIREEDEKLSDARWKGWDRTGRTSLHEKESPQVVPPLVEAEEEKKEEERTKMVPRPSSLSLPSRPHEYWDPASIPMLRPQQMEGEMLERRPSTSSSGICHALINKKHGTGGKDEEKKVERGQEEDPHHKDEKREEEEGVAEVEERTKSIHRNTTATTTTTHDHQNKNKNHHHQNHTSNQQRKLSKDDEHVAVAAAALLSTTSSSSRVAFSPSFSLSQSLCSFSSSRKPTPFVMEDSTHPLLASSI